MSVVMRCPKCKERYQPAGSLEAGDLDVRCPRCAQRKRQKRAEREAAGINLPTDPLSGSSSNWIWIIALCGGAVLLVLVCLGLTGLGLVHLGGPRNVATPAKAPTTENNKPTPISAPKPGEHKEPPSPFTPAVPGEGQPVAPPPRTNDDDWDR